VAHVAKLTRPVDIIETGYELRHSQKDWLTQIARAAAPDLDCGSGVFAFVSRITEDGLPLVSPVGAVGVDKALIGRLEQVNAAPPAGVADYVRQRTVSFDSFSRVFGRASKGVREMRSTAKVGDSVAGLAQDGENDVLQLIATAEHPVNVHPKSRRAWQRVMLHLAAALRLRKHAAAPVAILTPSGKVVHAEGPAQARSVREALVAAVSAMERARTGRVRRDPEEALRLWRGLVSGQWSLVDHFEWQGQRFLAARENAPHAGDPRGLSEFEDACLHYYLRNASTDEIAFALGRSPATVGKALSGVARRLGFPSRALLKRVGEQAVLDRLSVRLGSESVDMVVLGGLAIHSGWRDVLGTTVLEVAALAASGLSDAEIAARRGRSERTISNQLARAYRMLGVGGRSELARGLAAPPPSRPA